jgi:hypothetical protein
MKKYNNKSIIDEKPKIIDISICICSLTCLLISFIEYYKDSLYLGNQFFIIACMLYLISKH